MVRGFTRQSEVTIGYSFEKECMRGYKTTLKKINDILVVVFIITIVLFLFRYFLLGIIGIAVFCVLCPYWFRLLGEELMISFLKRHGGYSDYDTLTTEYSENVLSRLEQKKIVIVHEDVVTLVDPDRVCTFDPSRVRIFDLFKRKNT